MRVSDVMTRNVISIRPDDTILNAARIMLQNHISGLPVVDSTGSLVGMVTEGDFLRRSELGTERRRPKWIEFVLGPGRLASDFTHASGRKVEEVMTQEPVIIDEDVALAGAVEMMERNRIKRLPVLRDGKIVGIVSRANLVRAIVSLAQDSKAPTGGDAAIRDQILAALVAHPWAPRIDVIVKDGVAELWGTITDDRCRKACVVVAENVGGVRQVHDHIVFVEPMSGMAFPSPEDEDREHTPRQKDTASVNDAVARKTAQIDNRAELQN